MFKRLNVRGWVKWAVILPIFLILISDCIDALIADNYNPELPDGPEFDYHFYYAHLFSQIKMCLSSIAFLAICCIFKHCAYTWIATICYFIYETIGLVYCLLVFDYDLYINSVIIVIITGITLIPVTYIYKKWIG